MGDRNLTAAPIPKSLEEAMALLKNPESDTINLKKLSSKTELDALAAALPASNIHTLILPNQTRNDGTLDAMIDALPHMQLKSLAFEGGYLYDGAVCALAEKLPHTQINHLDVKAQQGNTLRGMCNLFDALSDTAVTHLEVTSSLLSNEEAEKLSDQLANGKISSLHLACPLMAPEIEVSFLSTVGNSALKTFHLETSGLHAPGAQSLAQSLTDSSITDFSLISSAMLADTAEILIQSLPQTDITRLQMDCYRLAQQPCIDAFAANLPHSKIEHLDLSSGSTLPSDLSAFFDVIPHSRVRNLDLRSFVFDEESAQSFENMLPKSGLHTLKFTPTFATTQALAKALPDSQIASLDVTSQRSKHIAMEDLISAIPHSSLTDIGLNTICITEDISACMSAAQSNHAQYTALTQAVLDAPHSLAPEDWRGAVAHMGALHQCAMQANPQNTAAQIDAQLTDSFLTIAQSDPQTCKAALFKLLPYQDAKHRLSQAGLPLEPKDVMDEAGNIKDDSFCRGSTLALLKDMTLWSNSNQYRTAFQSLPEAIKPTITNLHQVQMMLDRQNSGVQKGR